MKTFFLALGLLAFTVGVVGAFTFALSSSTDDQRAGESFRYVLVGGAVLASGGLLAPRTAERPSGPPAGYGGPPFPPHRG